MKWPTDRREDERLVVHRVVICADVATTMGSDSVLDDVGDLFNKPGMHHWDVFDVQVKVRDDES